MPRSGRNGEIGVFKYVDVQDRALKLFPAGLYLAKRESGSMNYAFLNLLELFEDNLGYRGNLEKNL